MSNRRRILSAFAIFAFATGLLAIAEAKKPAPTAVLKQTVAPMPKAEPAKKPSRAKKYLPVADFGDY